MTSPLLGGNRRKHPRIAFIEPVRFDAQIVLEPPFIQPPIPAVITGLSAGGISLQIPEALPRHAQCHVTMELPTLGKIAARGKVFC